MKDRE